jgi:hypothetical protein
VTEILRRCIERENEEERQKKTEVCFHMISCTDRLEASEKLVTSF